MNIGFDLDKVFINNPPLIPNTVIERLYRKKNNGELLYRIPSYPEQLLRKFSHLPPFRPLIKENVEFLKSIPRMHNKVYLISSRFGFLKKQTEALLKQHNLDTLFTGVYFNYNNQQPHIFKTHVLQKLKIDMYTDDDLALLNYVADQNEHIKLFWFNPNEKGIIAKNIHAITSLPDIFTDSLS